MEGILLEFEIGDNSQGNIHEIYDDIYILRKGDDKLERGVWARPLEEPQWEKIIKICKENLENTPDLILGARYAEACSNVYGLKGFIAGIKIIRKILEKNYFPKEESKRMSTTNWIDNKLANLLLLSNIEEYKIHEIEIKKNLNEMKISILELKEAIKKKDSISVV